MSKHIQEKSNEISHALELATWGELAWSDVLQIICSTLPGTVSHLIHHSPNESKSLSLNWHGIDEVIASNYESYFIQIDPWAGKIASLESGSVISSEEILPAHSLKNTEYYNDHLYMMDGVMSWSGLKINAYDMDNVFICVHYQSSQSLDYDKKYKHLLNSIKFAFFDAVKNTMKMDEKIKKIQSNAFMHFNSEELCIIVDQEMNIYEANDSAEAELFNRGIASIINKKLRFREKNTDDFFKLSVRQISSSFLSENPAISLRVKNTPYLVKLRRIGNDLSRPLLFSKPLIAISIKEIQLKKTKTKIKTEFLKQLFLLTETEANICSLISSGYSLVEASMHANITYEHARQRMKVIFQKTRTSNQIELNLLLSHLRFQMKY